MNQLPCPVDGCDYEGEKVERLRAHSNSSPGHDWGQIKESLEEQEGVVIEGNEVVEESLEEPDDQDDQPTDQPPTKEEMTDDGDQWSTVEQQDDQPEGDQKGPEKEPEGSPSGDSEGVGIPIPVDTTTLVILLGLAAMAVLLYQFSTTGEASSDDGLEQQDDEIDAEAIAEGDVEVEDKGLIGE